MLLPELRSEAELRPRLAGRASAAVTAADAADASRTSAERCKAAE